MAFPTTLPSYTITSSAESPGTTAGGLGLSPLLNLMEADITALGTKIGTGASTPPGSGYLFTSNSNGTSSWEPAPVSAVWGLITGTLADQTDLFNALDARVLVAGDTMTGMLTLFAAPTIDLHAATKKYVDDKATSSMVVNETPGGSINSSNTNFTTASVFATGSLQVYLNGQRLISGASNDYVEVSSGFTMNYAPLTGDVLLVGYNVTNSAFIQGNNSIIVQETPTGAVNSSNTSYTTLQSKYVAGSLEVFINGLQQTKTTDYTETTPGSGIFTMIVAPTTGDVLRVSYQFSTGASGNADTVDGIHANTAVTADNLYPLASNAKFPSSVLGTSRLAAIEASDLFTGGGITAATWTDFKANQNFTVGSATSIIIISVQGCAQITSTSSGATNVSSRVTIDSAGTPITRYIGGANTAASNHAGNPFAGNGFIIVTGLAAGVHTIKTQMRSSATNSVVFCRPSTQPDIEFFATYIWELGG